MSHKSHKFIICWQLKVTAFACLLSSMAGTPEVFAVPETTVDPLKSHEQELDSATLATTRLPDSRRVSEVKAVKEHPLSLEGVELQLSGDQTGDSFVGSIPEFTSPESYTATDLLLETNQITQRPIDLDTFCEAYPFNSRCLNRNLGTIEEPDTDLIEEGSQLPERNNRFYIRLGGGLQDRESAQDFIGIATFEKGYNLYGAIGYRFMNLRTEFEYKYFNNDFDELTFFQPGTTTPVPGPPETSPGASVDGRALMFNLYYDIDTGSRFRPYVGGGVGLYRAEINELSPPSFGGFVANGVSDDRFAYQLQAGIGYMVTDNLDILLGYRYFKGNQFDYEIEGFSPNLKPNGLETNTIELNVLYNF